MLRIVLIKPRIYLDHAATSPLRPEARAAMEEGYALWANPSSPHAEGRKAKAALEDARARIKRSLGLGLGDKGYELIFTSGASEAASLAFTHSKVMREFVSAVEHDALYCFNEYEDAEVLPVHASGQVNTAMLAAHSPLSDAEMDAREKRFLVAIQHINSETGSIQNLALISQTMGAASDILLADCAQSAGKIVLPQCDMAIVSAHKFGGPIGIGALLVKDYALLRPRGGHERGYRRGTENLPAVMGMAAALEAGAWKTSPSDRAQFAQTLAADRLTIGETADYILALTHPTMSAQALLIRLDAMGFAVSAGSACSSGTLKKSRVLDAFGVSDEVAARTIRVSLGWSTTTNELEQFAEAWRSLT